MQDRLATRLLVASARNSYDPQLEIDWSAPLVDGKWFFPERRCTLYGTPLWETLSVPQRIACSREELAFSISLGVWTEQMIMHLVSRYSYDRDVGAAPVRYALTEVADEIRHTIMFANVADRIGSRIYRMPWRIRESGRLLKAVAPVGSLWALALMCEEIIDRVQREFVADETLQPLVRTMARLHVVEEARHLSFARSELETFVPTLPKVQRSALRTMLAASLSTMSDDYFCARTYANAGLDGRVAREQARRNPHAREMFRYGAERIAGHYREIGLLGGMSERLWRRAGFL